MREFHGRQIGAARASNISVKELAKAAGVTHRTVTRLEIEAIIPIAPKLRHGHVARATFDKITAALRQRGVELVDEDDAHGAGVRWIRPRARR